MKYKRFPENGLMVAPAKPAYPNQYLEVVIQNAGPTRYTSIDTNERKRRRRLSVRRRRRQAAKKTPSNESYKNWFAFSKIGLTVSLGNSSRFRRATALNQIMTVNQVERKLVFGKKFFAMCCMTEASREHNLNLTATLT